MHWIRSGARVPVIETNHFSRVDDSPDRAHIDVHMQLSRWCMWKWRQWARGLRPPPLGAVVPHIIDGAAFRPADEPTRRAFRSEHGIPEDAFVFGRLGQPHHSKWSPVAFRAFASVAERYPEAWLLLIGLPIVVATAFIQHAAAAPPVPPLSGTTMEELYPASPERTVPSRLFTWKKAILGGVGAFVLLVGVGFGWIMFGDGMGSGTAEGPTSIEQSIAVLPFDDLSPRGEPPQHDHRISTGNKISIPVTQRHTQGSQILIWCCPTMLRSPRG